MADSSTVDLEPTVLGAAWRFKWLILGIMAGTAVLALVVASLLGPSYTATARVLVQDPTASILFEAGSQQRPRDYVADQLQIFQSSEVAQRAAEIVNQEVSDAEATWLTVTEGLVVTGAEESAVIVVEVEASDPAVAVASANAIVTAYEDLLRNETLESFAAPLIVLDDAILGMETEVNALQARILDLSTVVDPNLLALEAQMARNLERLVLLERERIIADEERQAVIRLEVDDINQQIDVLLAVQATQPVDPELISLREAQRLALISLQDLEERKARIELDSQLLGTGVTRTVQAVAAEEAGLATSRIILLGLIVGLVVGIGVAYALALRRRVFTERHQPEPVLGNPLLGEVPAFGYERIRTLLPTISDPQTAAAEGFRFVSAGIATQIDRQVESTGSRPVVLAVTSAGLSDGKTVTAANTAVAAAFEGMKVLAIDADFASQRLTEILLPANASAPGITELSAGLVQPDQAMGEVEGPSGHRLDLLSRGAERTTAPLFFRDPGLRRLLDRLRDTYDLIVVDCPPLLQVAYTSLVLDLCDMVMTVQPHQGSVTQARDLKDRLDLSAVPAIGYVYNFAPLRAEMAVSRGSMSDVLGEAPRPSPLDDHTSHPSPASDGGSTTAKARRSR